MLQTFSQSSLSLVWPDPTQAEFTSLKLGLSRVCLTALITWNSIFSKAACETTKSSSKQISTSVLRLYDRLYEMFRTFVLEIYKCIILTWMYINVVFTQFRLPNPMLQVMANAYLHFCSHSRESGRAGRKRQDIPPSPVAGIEPSQTWENLLLDLQLHEFKSL